LERENEDGREEEREREYKKDRGKEIISQECQESIFVYGLNSNIGAR
jgi:hypothetical protein